METLYGEKTVEYKDAMLSRCHVCKGKEHKIYDELIGESRETKDADRFAEVEMIEAMSPEERFAFFQRFLREQGIIKELENMGIEDGDTVLFVNAERGQRYAQTLR